MLEDLQCSHDGVFVSQHVSRLSCQNPSLIEAAGIPTPLRVTADVWTHHKLTCSDHRFTLGDGPETHYYYFTWMAINCPGRVRSSSVQRTVVTAILVSLVL